MSRIGIATITIVIDNENAYNYGNRLQNFALQEFLRKQGHDCETIRYKASIPERMLPQIRKKEDIVQIGDDVLRIIWRRIKSKELLSKNSNRKKLFDEFAKKHISYSEKIYDKNSDFSELDRKFDHFVVGSDQVWNPYCEGSNEFYYLTFTSKEKRSAYAPSIAVEDIPDDLLDNYRLWLSGFNRVSVREYAGQKLLLDKIGVSSELVSDPVFLLNEHEWSSIAADVKSAKPYFVTYFLGKQDVKTKKKIRQLEKKTGMKHVDIYTRDNPRSRFAGPEEFLGLIKNAEFICTDSFHGTAFSIIFHTPMVIFERGAVHKMNSRIDNILQLASIEKRSVDDILSGKSAITGIEFDADKKLERLIESSKKYLLNEVGHEVRNAN